jgi:hypothetical protein
MPSKVPVLLIQIICISLLAGLTHAGMAHAQSENSGHGSAASIKKTPPVVSHEAEPKWAELSPNQQQILQPLQNLWPSLEENRKRKWLAIAKNFPTLNPQAQATAQERMREWAALTPSQRYQARLHFTQSQQLSNDEKLAKWEEYQSLNEEEKHKLNQPKPVLPKGAAMVPRPVSPAKLTTTPVIKKEGQEKPPRIETAEVDPLTLLPIRKRVSSDKQ